MLINKVMNAIQSCQDKTRMAKLKFNNYQANELKNLLSAV
jgi:hypothetical protein